MIARAHVGGGIQAVADFQGFGARDEFFDELVVDFLVHGDAAGGGAALAGGAEAAPDGAVDGEIEVGVVHDDDDVLAAHFQMALFERGRAGGADDAAHFGGAGEADEVDIGMLQERRAGVGPVAENDVHDAARQAGFVENLHQIVGGERRIFGGLDDHRVAADQRGHRFPRRNRHREIPGRDQSRDADRRAHGHGEFVGQLGRSGLAEQAAAFAGHEVGHVDGFLHVAARFGEDFAHLAGHVAREFFLALHENLSGAEKNFGALGRGREAPFLEGALGGVDGLRDVFFGRRGKHADEFVGIGGIAVFDRFAGSRRDPFAIDVIFKGFGSYCGGHANSSG